MAGFSSEDLAPMKLHEVPREDKTTGYAYELPTTSSFYRYVISPSCDYIVDRWTPIWLSPDALTLCGLLATCLAPLALPRHPIIAGLLWIAYGIFDNLDGKQARKTKKSSVRGEFLDHCADSVASTLIIYMTTFGFTAQFPRAHWCAFLGCQVPFLLGCWYYNSSGRVLLGDQILLGFHLTVDEVNFILVPGLLLAHVCVKDFGNLLPFGYALMFGFGATCLFASTRVLTQIASYNNPMHYKIAISGVVYFLTIPLVKRYSDPLICMPIFAWLCSCLIFPQCAKKAAITPTFLQTDPVCPVLASAMLVACYLSNVPLALLAARGVTLAVSCYVVASQISALPGPA